MYIPLCFKRHKSLQEMRCVLKHPVLRNGGLVAFFAYPLSLFETYQQKGKAGDSLRSKGDTGQINEALSKVLCYNSAC